MINLHLTNNESIWINEHLITALRPSGEGNTDVIMTNDAYYRVLGKPSTIATMIEYKESK